MSQASLERHPAVKAWQKVAGGGGEPTSIGVLKKESHKSAVYRLAGAGPGGGNVVAKRCLPDRGALEWMVYRELLPQLPVPTLHCYGSVTDDESAVRWLFLEDAGDRPCLLTREDHRALTLTWLGRMHCAAQRISAASLLPERGAGWYRHLLREIREITLRALQHPALSANDSVTLEIIVRQTDRLEAHWDQIERICDSMPRTLVHGDLVDKNLRIRASSTLESLCVMDWEKAGWGVPAADLAECAMLSSDFTAYCSASHDDWPQMDLKKAKYLARVGTMFRLIDGLIWANRASAMSTASGRPMASVSSHVEHVKWYQTKLADWGLDEFGATPE